MNNKMLIFKKILEIKMKKALSSRLLKAICLTASLSFNIPIYSSIDFTWVGGVSENNMNISDNWNPSGPPGGNDNALFTTDDNPPVLLTSDTMILHNIKFFVPGVICTLEGDLSVENDVQNDAQISSIFNIQNGGSFTLDGGSLATGGISIYNLNASTLTVDNANQSSAIVNMQNGSLFNVDELLTMGSLSSLSSSDSIALQADLTFGDSSDQVINGVISGTGNLIKQGTSRVTLNGNNSFNGSVLVTQGSVKVNGSLSGNLTVFSGAAFSGTGTIAGTLSVENGGILSPGNSIGSITVGSLTLANGSTTNVEIAPNYTSTQIFVNNNASLGGTLNIIQDPGTYAKTGSYQIITASSIINNFSSISGGLPGFTFSLSSFANHVYLNYSIGIPTSDLSGNNLEFADYLNDFAPASPEFMSLALLSGEPLNAALDSTSPARNVFATFASQQTIFSLSDIVSGYLSNRRFFATGCDLDRSYADNNCCLETSPYTIWMDGFYQNARQSAEKQNPAFQFNSEAILIGIDHKQSPDVLLGGTLGYAHTHLKESQNAGNASINYYSASIYATIGQGNFYIEPALWGIFHQINNHRHIYFSDFDETANSKFNGWQMNSHLGFGLNNQYFFGKMEPFAAFDWVINWQHSFNEHGAGSLNMRQKAKTFSMLQSEIGLRFYEPWTFSWGLLGAKESVSYINRTPFNTDKITAAIEGSTSYLTLESLTPSQNLASVNFELFARLGENQNYTTSLEYEGEFGSKYKSNAGSLKFSVDF